MAILLERRKGKGRSTWDGATRHGEVERAAQRAGEALLSFRRDGSPVTVIVMLAWLAVAGVPPAAFPADNGGEKRKNDKTVSAVQHKHIKEVPTTMAVSLVTLWSSWAFLLCACAASEMGLRTSSRKPFSEPGNGKIPKKSVMIWRYGRKKVSLQIRKSCLKQ